ncbi:MAG: hypothetical protein IJ158_02765 [Treponema sp.]|nr:hypothetical protein [Treponema sp.]
MARKPLRNLQKGLLVMEIEIKCLNCNKVQGIVGATAKGGRSEANEMSVGMERG